MEADRAYHQQLFLIVDNPRVHHAVSVRQWVAAHREAIDLFFPPTHAPGHDPDKYLDNDLKQQLKNLPVQDTQEDLLKATLSVLRSPQRRPARIRACFNPPKAAMPPDVRYNVRRLVTITPQAPYVVLQATVIPTIVFCLYCTLIISCYHLGMTISPSPAPQPWTRRLSDKLRMAFHTACDEADPWVAERLLNQLCKHTRSPSVLPTGLDRRKAENLSGVCERLANLLLWRVDSGTEPAAQAGEDQPGSSPQKQ